MSYANHSIVLEVRHVKVSQTIPASLSPLPVPRQHGEAAGAFRSEMFGEPGFGPVAIPILSWVELDRRGEGDQPRHRHLLGTPGSRSIQVGSRLA